MRARGMDIARNIAAIPRSKWSRVHRNPIERRTGYRTRCKPIRRRFLAPLTCRREPYRAPSTRKTDSIPLVMAVIKPSTDTPRLSASGIRWYVLGSHRGFRER